MDVTDEDKVIGGNRSSGINKNLAKSQKLKNSIVLSNIDTNAKTIGFLTFKVNIAFIQLKQAFTKASII